MNGLSGFFALICQKGFKLPDAADRFVDVIGLAGYV